MRLVLSVVGLVVLFGMARSGAAADVAAKKARVAESYGRVPLSFEPNRGQTDAGVQWVARGPEYALFLAGHDAVLELNSIVPKQGMTDRPKIDSAAVRMNLVGAKAVTNAEGEDAQAGKANYFTGRNSSKWLSEVPTFGKVRLREVYPGIDLVYYGRQGRLEYDFVVAAGADPAKIALQFDGAKAGLAANGDLVLPVHGSEKEIRFDKPVVYQTKDGVRQKVAGAFRVGSDGGVSFALGAYDKTRELVIDPTLVFAGSLATGNQQTIPQGMAVDSLGEMVITGYTNDLTFPTTTGALQTNCQTYSAAAAANGYVRCGPSSAPSAFVTKLSADGGTLIYSTYLHGGGGAEQGHSVVVDAAGDAYVLGSTSSNDFPITSNAYQTTCLPFALGQNGAPVSQCDNFYNGGGTEYTVNGPTLFIAKLNPLGTALLYSTFFGGSAAAYPVGIALDSAGNMIFASEVNQAESPANLYPNNNQLPFPTTASGYQTTGINIQTPALSKLSADGQTLMYSTFLGSPNLNVGHESYSQAFALGQNGVAFLGGFTDTSDFPTTAGSFKPSCRLNTNSTSYCFTNQGFVAAIDTTKSGAASLVYASYLGGEQQQGSNIPEQEVYGLAADASNNLFVTGYTSANDFPSTAGVYQPHCNDVNPTGNCNQTAFLSKINPTGTSLTWSTLLGDTRDGGPGSYGASIAFDGAGQVYLYGLSNDGSGSFPQVNPISTYTSGNKVFLATFSADATQLLFSTRFSGPSNNAISLTPIANGLTVDAAGNMYIVGYSGDGGSFGTTTGTYSTVATSGFNRAFFAKISPNTPPSPSNGLTTNLLANPGAELGSIADWTPGGGGTPAVDSGTFDPGITPHVGNYDFVGGTGNPTDSLSQTVSIITQGITAAQVDSGTLFANVSFWEQGKNEGDPSDEASVTLTFLDANNTTISAVTIGPEDRHDGTWGNVTGIPAIPLGTRSITYTMNFVRNQGTNNDAFLDDNVLSVHTNTGLTIFPGTLHFGNVAVGQTSDPQTVSVTNQQATTTINISQIVSELGANPADFLESDNCPSTGALAPGASCTVTITFAPGGVGPKSAGIAISTDSVPPLQQISVDGTGTGGILQVNPGNLKTIAGNGTAGYSGDGGQAILAQLNQPNGVAFDPSGNLYIADDNANVIRKVDTTGKITTFAGTPGIGGFAGDGGLATQAELLIPFSVASDKNGNIFIQDTGNDVIRKVDVSTGKISTVAGTSGSPGRAGDGGLATAAKLNENQGARFDSAGNLYLALCPTGTIRKIDTTGIITTVAGTPGTPGFSGDGGQATAAQLQCPSGVTIDAAGNFYIADEFNQVIRKVNTAGVISTIAGTPGVAGFGGDGGAATSAKFNNPNDVVIDAAGKTLYVPDSGNNRVRKIDLTTGIITTASGGLNSAGSAAVNTPLAVTLDAAGDVYFSDSGNSEVQEVFPQGTQPFPATAVGSTAPAQTLTLSNIGNVDVTIPGADSFSTSGNPGDFSLTGGTCLAGATLTAGGGSCTLTITFTPTATGQRTLTVSIADNALNSPQSFTIGGLGTAAALVTPTITWPAPASILYGTPLGATQLDATATGTGGVGVAGTFAYTPAAGTVLTVGTQALSVTFTSTTAGYGPATATNSITVTQFTPVLSWATPAAITTTTPLSSTQLDATAADINGNPLAGTFAYSPAAGATLTAGTQTLNVTFTPTDATDYTTATDSVQIVVTSTKPSFVSNVGTALAVQAVGVTLANAGTLDSIQVLTQGATGLDFTAGPGGSCATDTTYDVGQSCTVNVIFDPQHAGNRQGAVLLLDGNKKTLGVAFLQGSGVGPQIIFGTGSQSVVGGGFNGPQGLGLDGAGNIYVADQVNGAVKEIPFGCVTASCVSTLASGFKYPNGLAVDAAGNVFFDDFSNSNDSGSSSSDDLVEEIPFGCTSSDCLRTLGSGFGLLSGVGVDGSGNVFVSDFGNNAVKEIVAVNGVVPASPTINVLAGGFTGQTGPDGLTLDASGNVFVTNHDNGHALYEIPIAGGYSTLKTISASFTAPEDVAFDGTGNAFVVDEDTNALYELPAVSGSLPATPTINTLASNFSSPEAVAVDAVGNVYVADYNNNQVVKIDYADAPNLSFVTTTTVGSTDTTDGPQKFTIQNNGNAALTLSSIVASTNFKIDSGTTTCSTDATLAAGASCVVGVDFVPTAAGSLSGTLTLTDNALNVAGATQSIPLSGTGVAGTSSPTTSVITWVPTVATISYGTALGAAQLDATAATAGGVAIPGTFVYTPAAGAILPVGTQTLSVAFTPTSTNFSAATGSTTITVTKATPLIAWPTPAKISYGTPLSATQLDAAATGVGGAALPGTFVYTPTAGTVLTAGTQTLSVAFTPMDGTDYKATTGSVSLVVAPVAATIAWATPASIVYGTALGAAQLDASATGLNGVALPGTFVYTPAAGAVLNAGTQTLSVAFTPTNANYAVTTGSVNLVVKQATATLAWAAPATIVYGTALSATQLDATATGVGGIGVPGTFVYTPAATTVLAVGAHTLSVAFTPTSANYLSATGGTTITVTQATPVITWTAPTAIAYGTPLSGTQLDATVAGVSAGALPGTLVYTPAPGAVLNPGTQTLRVAFTPTDAVDYTVAAASVQLVVSGPTLTSFTPAQVVLGSANTTITLTGTGFVATSVVQVNGTAVATAYVNPTTLTAVIPAALLTKAVTLQVAVTDPSIEVTTPSQTFTVLPIPTSATLSGPSTTPPGSQPSVTLAITNPYPLPITAQFNLTFASLGSTQVNDPAIEFSNGLRTFSYVVAANSTTVPPVQLQAGTVAGTITIAVKLVADGLDVTPTTLAPVVIVVPPVVPVLSGTTVTRSGNTLTVVIHGFSNTREVSSAVFDFTAATGDTLATPSVTIPATTLFGGWFDSTESETTYGSTFTYTQVFNTSGDASTVGTVKVTLTNSVGVSEATTSQ